MYLHITFEDNSNPFVKYGNKEELKKELSKWRRNYNLKIEETEHGFNVKASDWFVIRSAV